jgi:membrane associated rhomboid family serine protease
MNTAKRIIAMGRSAAPCLPGVTALIICVMAAMQLAINLLPSAAAVDVFVDLSFVPARISFLVAPEASMQAFAGVIAAGFDESVVAQTVSGAGLAWWTPLTYAMLHGGWTHLTLNCITLAAFGSLLEQRFGANRFLAFLAVSAVFGALTHFVVHPFNVGPLVGSSAVVSAMMAASARVAFAPGGAFGAPRFSLPRWAAIDSERTATLSHSFISRLAVGCVGMWVGVTLLCGLFPLAAGAPSNTAWETHIGGFAAGMLLFDLFDPYGKKTADGVWL